jgi:hypothetical protein
VRRRKDRIPIVGDRATRAFASGRGVAFLVRC